MWVGWNSQIKCNNDTCQKIWYLPQIDMSPTSSTVVVQTMKVAQSIAQEMGKSEISVTYDLAIAKLAMQIQAEESPRFDNIFVFLGQFHTEMAFFNALGKFIADSGGPAVLISSEAIAGGSVKGFLTGKHYNRCKRIHPILAAAMESLLIREFLSQSGNIDLQHDTKNEIFNIHNDLSPMHGDVLSKELSELIESYENFKEYTRKDFNCMTAQY